MRRIAALLLTLLLQGSLSAAAQDPDLKGVLAREIIGPAAAMEELQAHLETRILTLPQVNSAAEGEATTAKIRAEVLDKIIFRGEAARWRELPTVVEWKG